MKKVWCVSLALMMMLVAVNASAVTVWIGDDDGFGFDPAKVPTYVGVDKKPVDRNIENRKVQFIEVLPKFKWTRPTIDWKSGDNWDNRTPDELSEIAKKTGAIWTDVTLCRNFLPPKGTAPGLAKDVVFTFDFTDLLPFKKNAPGYGEDHVMTLIFADYDVEPMEAEVDGTVWPMTPFVETGTVDGGIGSLTVPIPWKDMEDGIVVVKLLAPQELDKTEPYTVFDYVLLDEAALDIGPYPLCANEEIPIGTHYIVDTGAAKSTLDKATLDKGVQLTVLSPRSAQCKPKTTGKGEPGHYLHCSDTFIANRNYFVFPESMAEEISAALAEKENTEGSGMIFTIWSTSPKDCPLPEKGDKPKNPKKDK